MTDLTTKIFGEIINSSDLQDKTVQNILRNIQQFNITPNQWKKCLLKQLSLFTQKPETIHFNITETARKLGMTENQRIRYLEAALERPPLFTQTPETNHMKFEIYFKFINQNREEILDNLLNNPILFDYAPERIMAFYVISKLSREELHFRDLRHNPIIFTRRKIILQRMNQL